MHNILVIEDDLHLRGIIFQTLSKEYQVSCCGKLSEGYSLLESRTYDVIITDRLLPDGDALELVEYVSDSSFSTKILAISRLFEQSERIKGLELGADEYLPKPFSLAELKLKIGKLVQYEKKHPQHSITVGTAIFTPSSGGLLIDGTPSHLRKKESDILQCLCQYQGQVVSRELLISQVWKDQENIPSQTTLDVYIRRIRMALKNNGNRIVTKRGFGYVLKTS